MLFSFFQLTCYLMLTAPEHNLLAAWQMYGSQEYSVQLGHLVWVGLGGHRHVGEYQDNGKISHCGQVGEADFQETWFCHEHFFCSCLSRLDY